MRTIKIDIINEKVLKLLQDLEVLKLIRLRKDEKSGKRKSVDWKKYKGSMSKQNIAEVDTQLKELRKEWE